jgi:O-antigen ligase
MIILVVAVWAARDGSWRAAVAACAAAVVAGGLSLIDHFAPGAVANGPLGWIGFWKDFNGRLGGAVPSPNGMAALLIVPTAVLIFWGVLGRGRAWTRVAALAIAVPMLVALYVTYSRAALLALFVLAVILCWRIRRTLGIAVLVVGIAGGAVLLPSYLQLRSQSAPEGAVTPGSILVASDEYRFRAWGAAIQMWQDQPITGQGFLAYKQLADSYGDPVLGSPHNEWLRLLAEEGTVGGLVGLSFLATTLWWLARRRDAIGGGVLSGVAGYFLMASFNNPLLFTQISAVVFVALGYGLARANRQAPEPVQLGPLSSENGLPPEDLPPQANEALLA